MRTLKPHLRSLLATTPLLALMLAGCGGSGDGTGALASNPNPPPQCAANGNCPPSGFDIVGAAPAPLCSPSLDYSTVFTGGSGAGELVKMKFDTTKKTYELEIVESPVPKKAGAIYPTREGVTFKGGYANLTSLPTAEQNRCALQLKTAVPSDPEKSQAIVDAAKPPIIYLGHGVAGGGIPGATIQFDGVLGTGAIPTTTFEMYPVMAFAETETDFSKVPGTYNLLGFHLVPSGGKLFGGTPFDIASASSTETLNADGSCTRTGGACVSTGNPWTARADGAFESNNDNRRMRYPAFSPDAVTPQALLSQAKGIMVVGKLQGMHVPLVLRVGFANLANLSIDDESGMALMAPNKPLMLGQLNGGYMGSGSDFKYTVSLVADSKVTLLDALTMENRGAYEIDWNSQSATPGMVTTTDPTDPTDSTKKGLLIAAGPAFAHLTGNTFRASVFASH